MARLDSNCQSIPDAEHRQKADVVVSALPRSFGQHRYRDYGVDGDGRSAGEAQLVGHSDDSSLGELGRARRSGLVGLTATSQSIIDRGFLSAKDGLPLIVPQRFTN